MVARASTAAEGLGQLADASSLLRFLFPLPSCPDRPPQSDPISISALGGARNSDCCFAAVAMLLFDVAVNAVAVAVAVCAAGAAGAAATTTGGGGGDGFAAAGNTTAAAAAPAPAPAAAAAAAAVLLLLLQLPQDRRR